MATPIEDFLITLGFDTSKVKSQIEKLNTDLNKLAVSIDAKRVKQGLATQKKIATEEIKTAKATAKEILKLDKETAKQRQRIYADSAPKPIVVPSSKPSNPKGGAGGSRGGSPTSPLTASTRKQAALRQLRNQIAEYERSTTGPSNASNRYKYYERGNASIAKIQAYTEELRGKNTDTRNRMKAEGSLKSFDSASSSKAEMDMLKASNAIEVLRVQMQKLGIATKDLDKNLIDSKDVNSMKKLAEQTRQQIRLHKEQNKLLPKTPKPKKVPVDKRPTAAYIDSLMNNYRVGAVGKYDPATQRLLQQQAMGQSSQGASRAYLNAAGDIQKYQRLDPSKVQSALSSGSVIEIRAAQKELARMNSELERTRRHAIGAQAAFSSMHDSTRNMVREYASLYALISTTGAISESAKAYDGMQAGLVAVTNSAAEADTTMKYLKDTILTNGLSMKDAGKDFVKLKAAMGKDKPIQDSITAFEALARTGVVFQISQDDMSGTIRA